MTVTFYLEIQNGEKYTWINHQITKQDEIEWLLKEVRKKCEEALAIKDIQGFLKPPQGVFDKTLGNGKGEGWGKTDDWLKKRW